MSLHGRSGADATGTRERTHRAQVHEYRILGDMPPEECLPLAIDGLWRMIVRRIGIVAAHDVGIGNVCVETGRVILRIWTPIEHADVVGELPTVFDFGARRWDLEGACWRKPGLAVKEMRRRALEKHGSCTLASTGTLLRLSVPWKTNPAKPKAGRRYDAITAFLKSSCSGLLRTSPGSMRIVGTMEQPSSTSVVVEIPESLAKRIERLSSTVRITRFSEDDLGKVRRGTADAFASVIGCRVHIDDGRRIARREAVGTDPVDGRQVVVAKDVRRRTPAVRGTRNDALQRAWRLMASVLELLGSPFLILRAMETSLSKGTPRVLEQTPTRGDVWTLLQRVLPSEDARISACWARCEEFGRVATRWGDARSAETSSSVDGLLVRLGDEMADMVEWSTPEEAADAAKDVLETLERLGLRAEEERLRLVSGLRGRLDTTRRFVELKLEDSDPTSLCDLHRAS